MPDPVERARQVRVQRPHAPGQGALARVEYGRDRVVAAPSRPEPVGSGLEPGLPLGLQRVPDPCLMTTVHYHRDGAFIMPLLQSGVWMSGCGTGLCWQGPQIRDL